MLSLVNLHNYQRACVKHIIEHPYCGLFLEMGLGKTISTLTAIEALKFDYCEINSVLVIAPKRVAETVWAEEAANWEHTKHLSVVKIIGTEKQRIEAVRTKADIHVISRDNIAWLCALFAARLPYDMVVIDELSSFKSFKSQRFKSLRLARPWINRVVGLTGTPAPNSLIDLWPQMYLIDRGQRLEKTVTAYRQKYFYPGKSNGYVVYSYSLVDGASNSIHEKIGDICISMKAKDYLEMPPMVMNVIKVKMDKNLRASYKEFEKDNILNLISKDDEEEETKQISAVNAAGLSNKLLQFANGAIYDEDKTVHRIHSLKLDALADIIEEANGKPILVAWSYQFDRDRIKTRFKGLNIRELKTPKDIEDWNAGNIQILLAHPASAGHGLNLQAGGHIVVWYGLTWSLELYEQFNARLYRQGQSHSVLIHHIVTEETHDEDVMVALKAKSANQNRLMESIKAKIDKYKSQMQ